MTLTTPPNPKPKIRSRETSPRERVVRAIVTGLYNGKYRPGDRLVEARLAEEFGVSRGPLREAFNRLAAMGVVSLHAERGASIRALSVAEAIETLVVVQALLGLSAQLAAKSIDAPGAADKLRQSLAALVSFDSENRSSEHAYARDSFYSTLSDIAGNAELRRVLGTMQTHLIRVQYGPSMPALDRERQDDYRAISEAIFAGDAAAAQSAARLHVARALKALQKLQAGSGTD